jgi:hypothetical protein
MVCEFAQTNQLRMRDLYSWSWLNSCLERSMTNAALMKPPEQARRIVDLWQERPRWQRTAEHLLAFYGWLSEYEPAVIPSGPGSILKVCSILSPHLLPVGASRIDSCRVR